MSDSVRPHRQQPTRLPRPWDSPGKNTGVGCHFFLQCMKVKSESEVTKVKSLSRVRLLATSWTAAYQARPSMGFSRQEYWSGVPLPIQVQIRLHVPVPGIKTSVYLFRDTIQSINKGKPDNQKKCIKIYESYETSFLI